MKFLKLTRLSISYYKRDTGVNADSYEEIYAVMDSIYKSFYAPINVEVPSVVVDEYDLYSIMNLLWMS